MKLVSIHFKIIELTMFKEVKAKNDTRNDYKESNWNSGPEKYNNKWKTQWIGSLANYLELKKAW